MQIEVVRTVAAPPRAVFSAVSDIANWPRIFRTVHEVEVLTSGPIRVGTRLRESCVMLGHEATVTMEVATLEPPHRLRLTAENRGMHWERDYLIDALELGSRITLIFRTRPENAVGRTFQPLMSPFMQIKLRDELEQDLADLTTAAVQVSGS